ncbi:MAG: tetratricopeptide repeat protein [Leptospirales bacterium]|nr:tetratricopeptide repeat protein [Leptospirales bacterium]
MSLKQGFILMLGVSLLTGGVALLAGRSLDWFRGEDAHRQELRQTEARLREADELLRQNSEEGARQAAVIYNQVLSQNIGRRTNQFARFGLAAALERTDNRPTALDYFRELKSDPQLDPELRDRVDFSVGRLLLFINHEEEGRSLLEGLLARNIDQRLRSHVHTAFGYFYLRAGEFRRARDNFRVALKYHPENLEAERGRALAASRGGREWAGYAYYDEYLTGNANLQPHERATEARALGEEAFRNGMAAERQGRHDEAIRHFRRSLEGADADLNERATYWMAESYAASGGIQAALAHYDRVLRNGDRSLDQPALIQRGILLSRLGKLDAAARSFQRAIDDFPAGAYTEKAIEWKREIDAQIQERFYQEDLERRPNGQTLYPEGGRPPAEVPGGDSDSDDSAASSADRR